MPQKRMPRLTLQDMKDLRRGVANLMAAVDTLKSSSWASAAAVRELVMSAVMVMGPMYDKAEPAYLEILNAHRPRKPWQRAAAAAAVDQATDDPGAGQDEPQED